MEMSEKIDYCTWNNLDSCIFGWKLFQDIDVPIAHHAGIIIKWVCKDPWMSIVAHYGSDCTSRVLVERLKDAVMRSQVNVVRINPYYKAKFAHPSYSIGKNNNYIPGEELKSFEEEHPEYNVVTSNCQHFVQRFVGNIPIESDVFNQLSPIMKNIIHTATFGKQEDIEKLIGEVADSYNTHRTMGICAWDPVLDLDVPTFQ